MGLFKSKQSKAPLVLRDLDKLVAEPVSFRLHGKVFTLNPVTVAEFWKFSEAMVKIQALAEKPGVKVAEVIDGYAQVFQSVCPTITREDVESMTQPQVGALFQFVADTIRGASQLDDYELEKKSPQPA